MTKTALALTQLEVKEVTLSLEAVSLLQLAGGVATPGLALLPLIAVIVTLKTATEVAPLVATVGAVVMLSLVQEVLLLVATVGAVVMLSVARVGAVVMLLAINMTVFLGECLR